MNIIYDAIKKYMFRCLLLLVLVGQSAGVWAEQINVKEKIVINASSHAVWAIVGGFNALDRWHPDVAESMLIGTGKAAGDIRVLTLINNETIVERLDSYNEDAMNFQYRIIESPLPVKNYVASVSVVSAGDHLTEVVWQSSFNAVNLSKDEVRKIISGIYITGLSSLNKLFE